MAPKVRQRNHWTLTKPGAAAILVPWEFGPDCEPSGVQSVVTAWLRPKAGWIGGVQTLDAENAGFEPRWVDHDPRWPHHRSDLMSALKYLTFVQILPTQVEFERQPAEVRRRIDTWGSTTALSRARSPGRRSSRICDASSRAPRS